VAPPRREAFEDVANDLIDRVRHRLAGFGHAAMAPYPTGAPRDSALVICNFDDACRDGGGFEAVISIESPDSTPATGRLGRFRAAHEPIHKVLRFHDIESRRDPHPPLRHHVRAGLAFARRHAGRRLLIHCHAGVSRSTALAYAILVHRAGPDCDEARVLERILELRPQACPNRLVVRHADVLLGRGGRMLRAVEAHPVIQETRRRNFSPPSTA
jgi:predicted protein tyrosine phosphatase